MASYSEPVTYGSTLVVVLVLPSHEGRGVLQERTGEHRSQEEDGSRVPLVIKQ